MARVTKINVGGTNYDIAHEGELKNSGFEVVTSLPTTGLFEGREVVYQGKKYVYSTFRRSWIIAFDEKKEPVYNIMGKREFYEILGYDYTTYSNNINRSYLSKYDNYCKYTNDFLIETSVDNETFIAIDRADKAYQIFSATNTYSWNVASYKAVRLTIGKSEILTTVNILSFYINHYNLKVNKIKIDHQLRSDLSWEDFGEVDFTSVNPRNYALFFSVDMFSKPLGKYGQIFKIRFTIEFDAIVPTNSHIYNVFLIAEGNKYLAGINNYFNLSYKLLDCYSTLDYPITLNYDIANIEPTQTGEVEKKANWVLRYLLQGVNWLKANKVALSVYNAKVAALEQADSDNNASIQSVSTDLTELSNGLATVATSGSYEDLTNTPTQLPNPNPIIIKTADNGVSVRYDGSTSGGVILEAGDNASVTATQDSDDMMTVKFGAVVPQTLPNPNALNITVLDSEGALLGASMVYDGVAAKYFKLIEGYGIRLSNSNLSNSNSHEVTINLKQIAGTTLLGNANGTTDIPQAITMAQLRTMLGSLTLNGISVTLGGNSSYTLPCFISYSGTLFQARIENNWLQIYRNGVWANLYYLLSSLPTECRYITDLSDPSWYDELVSEYELDSMATEQLLRADSSTNIANWIEAIYANRNTFQITFNSSVIPCKEFNKGALDNIISNLKGKGYSVFVENDIDTILSSGNDWVMSIKIKRFNNLYKAIIECYVAR